MAEIQLKALLQKYKNENKVLQKIEEYVTLKLPKLIAIYLEKEARKEALELEMEKYIFAFFLDSATQFYYIPTSNTFVQYDGKHYHALNEDIIWHTILSDISEKGVLLDWKYLVKTKIIKAIKERILLSAIPESETIQAVISFLTPGYFTTKEEVKYFLTCLGDNILKRPNCQIQLIDPSAKGLMNSIQEKAQYIFGNSITTNDNFYFSHVHQKSNEEQRLLRINIVEELNEYWHNFLSTSILDLLVVSCHYSTRFGGSDNYISQYCHNAEVLQHVLYLKNKSNDSIITDFVNAYIVKGDNQSKTSMSWGDLFFLWNEYIDMFHYPNMMDKEKWRELLTKQLDYDTKSKTFPNITSKYLKYVRIFTLFWNETITDASNTTFEISEICKIYNDWLRSRQPGEKVLSEKKIHAIIQYFLPHYSICNFKYIPNIQCSLWDKNKDIEATLQYLKLAENLTINTKRLSFYKLYKLYCEYAKKRPFKYIASKKYFENQLRTTIPKESLSGEAILAAYWKL
jgi:hypothetical protein